MTDSVVVRVNLTSCDVSIVDCKTVVSLRPTKVLLAMECVVKRLRSHKFAGQPCTLAHKTAWSLAIQAAMHITFGPVNALLLSACSVRLR